MIDVAVLGAGQLGSTLAILLDRWAHRQGIDMQIFLVDSAVEPLAGATRAAWINHVTGLEYFNDEERQTSEGCIEGAIAKRLLLPPSLHDMPVPLGNRFLVSRQSVQRRAVALEMFHRRVQEARVHYQKLHREGTKAQPSDASHW